MVHDNLCRKAPRLTGFVNGVWNPEDLVALPGTPWIIVSAMRSGRHRGGLLAIDTDDKADAIEMIWTAEAEAGRSGVAVFDPHGIAVRQLDTQRHELLVIDHGGGEAIDRLIIDTTHGLPRIVAGARIDQPVSTSGNAIAHRPDGGFVMTGMFDPRDPDTLSKFAKADPTGCIWQWSDAQGWSELDRLPLSGANGIAVSPDGSFIIACEWAARRVWRLTADGEPQGDVETRFLPDNLRWTRDGRLILAGQAARPEAVFGCEARGECCPLAFEVVVLDPHTLAIEALIAMDHAQATAIGFGGATGGLLVGDELWVGSFTGQRIARFAT